MSAEGRVFLTCVYCGEAYPQGTPSHGSKVLTDHIKICEKHPMRQAQIDINKLRAAVIGLVGSSDRTELEAMKAAILAMPACDSQLPAYKTIQALLETETA